MKIAKACATLLLTAALPLAAQAETPPPPRGPAMMGPGGGMMGGPAGPGAPRHGMAPPMHPGMMAPPPFAGVQFNEEQRKTIQKMMAEERQAHQQRVQKMQQFQNQLRELYSADKWDAAAITKLYEKMHAEQRRTIAAMAEARNRVYDMLTKEQREQMKRAQQEQMQRRPMPPQPPQPPMPPQR